MPRINASNVDELNCVDLEKKCAILQNTIELCMIENIMTLEHLDYAYAGVKEFYRKNASIQALRTDGSQPSTNPCDMPGNSNSSHQTSCSDVGYSHS